MYIKCVSGLFFVENIQVSCFKGRQFCQIDMDFGDHMSPISVDSRRISCTEPQSKRVPKNVLRLYLLLFIILNIPECKYSSNCLQLQCNLGTPGQITYI